ncbi:hypothetical protein [Roseimaritima ulvae]|uniref:Uncharacterized protein n=1 Tax=Roseimaritima ulvae TaxID=980254 RepID=A0A5B9QQY6_9BACT|nr:hypothetical protein [Roseimaritima ulvae]QEG39835.1 hypothetical protein UC8_18340 [Roseimaritima ulvae]
MVSLGIRTYLVLACLACLGSGASAQDSKLAKLLDRSPSPANSLAYVHVESLNRLMHDAEFSSKLTSHVDDIWLIADLDLGNLRPRWEAGYAVLKAPVAVENLAQGTGGYVDTVEDTKVVWSPRQAYLLPLSDNRLGFLRPANRPLLTRWLEPDTSFDSSIYLAGLAQQPEAYLSFMLAADLRGAFSAVPMAKKLEDVKALKANKPETVAHILASAKGLSVIIGRKSLSQCILTIDFSRSPSSLLPIANELAAELLNRNGTSAPEVLTWDVKAKDNQLVFQGPITEGSLAGLLNIFSLPGEAENVSQRMITLSDSAEQSQDNMGYSTKHYFDEVTARVEQVRKHHAKTTGAMAKWNDQQARRLDQLSTLNVDPQMVQYGSDVAELLRGNALTVRSGNIAAGKVKASQSLQQVDYVSGSYGYRNGYYGGGYASGSYYYDPNTSVDYQRVTDAYARGNAYGNYRQVLSEIDKRTAAIRRMMTDKYKMQF